MTLTCLRATPSLLIHSANMQQAPAGCQVLLGPQDTVVSTHNRSQTSVCPSQSLLFNTSAQTLGTASPKAQPLATEKPRAFIFLPNRKKAWRQSGFRAVQ